MDFKYFLIFLIFNLFFFVLIYLFYKHHKLKNKKNFEANKKPSQAKYIHKYINKELEQKLLDKLLDFEKSSLFLDHKFNLQILAKKLKTNTSYLSYIINEKKGKTFNFLANI